MRRLQKPSDRSAYALFLGVVVVSFVLRFFVGGLSVDGQLASYGDNDHRGLVSLNVGYSKPCALASIDGDSSAPGPHICFDCPLCFGRAHDAAPVVGAQAQDAAIAVIRIPGSSKYHPRRSERAGKPAGWSSSWSSRGSPTSA